MQSDPDRSLSDEATSAGHAKRQRSDASLGAEQTLGDGLSGQETIIDDIEVIDLEARYRIEGQLGQGGMGAVLLATDTRLDRKVAIKRILGEAAGNRMAVTRFLTEAKSIAALNHPNIVQIYDYGRAKDGPFLIMEFLDGGSLLDRCRDGAMPLEDAVDLACQLCDGLAKAHDLGIIHRDIKPANVLLTKDGIPKLTDFGLAKAQAGDHGQTMTGAVLGTPDFMPPEQRRDASLVDHRSDLWSLAATVYQMVTGRSPKIIRFDLLPVELTKVLGKALEDAKDDRYQTARELRDAIKASLRAASPDASAIAQGQCPSCGVQNDASRRFCRGCGGSLEAPCLSCEKPMPMWEEICGSCGAKQTAYAEPRRAEMAAMQAKAEGLLGDFAFDKAAELATRLRDEPHARLAHLKAWAERFLSKVETSRSQQIARAAETLAEAVKHEQAFDYLSAVFSLESIPDAMRSVVLPGAHEPVTAVFERLKHKQALSCTLEELVKQRIAAKAFDGLLPEVDKLLELQPDRSDIHTLRQQLVHRQRKQEQARDEALATARMHLSHHDYAGAVSELAKIPTPLVTPEISRIRVESEERAARTRSLGDEIHAAVASSRLEGLLGAVVAYLELKPDDTEVRTLRQSLVEREGKIAAAMSLLDRHDYDRAAAELAKIPDFFVTPEIRRIRSESEEHASRAKKLREDIRAAVASNRLDGLIAPVNAYLGLKPEDAEVGRLRQSLAEREEKITAEITAKVKQAQELASVGCFSEAVSVLQALPARRDNVAKFLSKCNDAATQRSQALALLNGAQLGEIAAVIHEVAKYKDMLAAHGLRDAEFADALETVTVAAVTEANARRVLRAGLIMLAICPIATIFAMTSRLQSPLVNAVVFMSGGGGVFAMIGAYSSLLRDIPFRRQRLNERTGTVIVLGVLCPLVTITTCYALFGQMSQVRSLSPRDQRVLAGLVIAVALSIYEQVRYLRKNLTSLPLNGTTFRK